MAVPTVFALHGISTPSQFFSQIEEASPSPAITALLGAPSGFPQPLFRGIKGMKPVLPFRTSQLATLFTAGAFYAELGANTDLFYRKITNFGTRDALTSTVHTRLRMIKAMLVCRQIQARLQQEATAQVEIFAVSDGTNNPLTATGSLAATGTPSAAEYFALGPVSLNGTLLDGVQEVTIDPGFQLLQVSGTYAYDTFVAIKFGDPSITIRGLDISPWVSYGPAAALSSTGLIIYLRKLNADGATGLTYIADATGAHIKFSVTNGLITIDSGGGGGQAEATAGLKIYPRAASASVDALIVAVGQAIS